MNRRPRHILREERGVAATEFALVLPILTLLMFSFYEAGRIYWNYNVVQSSARDAARYAARLPMSCDSGGAGALTNAGDETAIKNLTRTGTPDGAGSPLVSGWTDNATVTVAIGCVDNTADTYLGRYDGIEQIPTVTITAAAPYSATVAALIPGFNLSTITVSNAQPWTE